MNSRTCSGWIRRISRGHMNSWRKCTPSSERQTPNWRSTSTSWSHSVSVSKTSFTILMMWSVYDKDHMSEQRIKNRSERDLCSCGRTIVRSRAIFIPEWLENLDSDTVNWFWHVWNQLGPEKEQLFWLFQLFRNRPKRRCPETTIRPKS